MPRPTDRLAALELAVDELVLRMFRSPNGPGTIRGKAIKPKAVTAGHIAVSDLESVNAKTGNLSVTGSITLTTAGHISAGQNDFNSGTGFWLDNAGGVPRFSIGNGPSGSRISWDGTVLNVAGTITATDGEIGGFSIGSTDLTAGSGSSHIGFSSSGSVRIWSGSETPSAAPFQVSSAGVLTATGATIKSGAGNARAELTAVNGVSVYDSGGTVRGRLSTDGSGFLGSTNGLSTGAAVRWTSAGAATINADAITTGTINAGTITVSNLNATNLTTGTLGNGGSGIGLGGTNGLSISGNLTLASGGKIIDADGSYWDQNGIVLKSGGVFGDSIKWQVSGVDKGSIYASVNDVVLNFPSGGSIYAGSSDAGIVYGGGSLRAGTAYTWGTAKHYPGYGTNGQQFTYYIEGGGAGAIITNGIGIGGMLGISSGNTINLIAPGTGAPPPTGQGSRRRTSPTSPPDISSSNSGNELQGAFLCKRLTFR
ncbi:MAG: hypothetical protein M5U18_01230 [Dehalococcoidia bacterium]|nr:hypothetical protein [Dehalococcoidia bacterium]